MPSQESFPPLAKGLGDLNFLLLRHCEERLVRRGNLYHPLSHSEESGVFAGRRKNLII